MHELLWAGSRMRNLVSYKHRPFLTEGRITQGAKSNDEKDRPSSWGKQLLRSRFEAISRTWQDAPNWISALLLDSDPVFLLFLLPFFNENIYSGDAMLDPHCMWGLWEEDHWSLLLTALQRLERTILQELHPKSLTGTWNWFGWLNPGLQIIWDFGNCKGGVRCLLHVEKMWIVVDRGWIVADSMYQKWLQDLSSHTLCFTLWYWV